MAECGTMPYQHDPARYRCTISQWSIALPFIRLESESGRLSVIQKRGRIRGEVCARGWNAQARNIRYSIPRACLPIANAHNQGYGYADNRVPLISIRRTR